MSKFRLDASEPETPAHEQAEVELARDLLDALFRVAFNHNLPTSGKGLLLLGRLMARLAVSTLLQAGLGGGQLVVIMNVEVGKTLHGLEEAAKQHRQRGQN